jgi:bacterioferritin-associated ferredoxin
MIVCVCHQVSDRTIAQRSREGLSFDELQFELRVATQCGRCEDCARQVHHDAARAACQAVVYLHKSGDCAALTPQAAI